MYSHKTIIDINGFIIEKCVLFKDGMPQSFEITQDMQIVDNRYNGNLVKPKFVNNQWVEGATEEEIKQWQEKNIPKPKEPTEVEQLQKQLLETQNLVLQLQNQILLNNKLN